MTVLFARYSLRYKLSSITFISPPRSTLFPYTTLFRSAAARQPSRPGRRRPPTQVCRRSTCVRSPIRRDRRSPTSRSEEHTSELQSLRHLVCRLLLEKKNTVYIVRRQCVYTMHLSHIDI